MPFDGIVTRAVVTELKETIVGGRINKIYQPTETELFITIRNQRENHILLISTHPMYARMHVTNKSIVNPPEPPMFCMVLRKHLQGSIIQELEQFELERIVAIDVKGRDEIGDEVVFRLMIEIMGKHSNVSLINKQTDKIINCMKHVPPYQNRYRTLLPGATYTFPPSQDKLNVLKATGEDLIRKLDFNAGKMEQQIVRTVTGISPFVAKDFVHKTNLRTTEVYEQQFEQLKQQIVHCDFHPAIYKNSREDYHVIRVTSVEHVQSFQKINELLDYFYENKAERDRITQQTREIKRKIVNEIDKNKRKIAIHEQAIQQEEKASTYQKYGELLTANMHQMKQGATSITVIDYYDEAQKEIDIPLLQDLTPSENAQRYFKRYRKLQTAAKMAQTELKKAMEEIQYLETILQQLEQANEEDVEEIKVELEEEGYVKKQRTRGKKRKKITKPTRYLSADGTEIFVGKNNKQNEYATFKLANKEDIWLHTLNIPGSHVIIKSTDPSEQTLLEAAQLAAYYSKAKQSDSVPVDYTKVKNVKKVAGAKPGFVTYTDQKTLFVTPKRIENTADQQT